jgi:hypothetical protein
MTILVIDDSPETLEGLCWMLNHLAERTAELQAVKDQLQREIEQRTLAEEALKNACVASDQR